MKPCLQQGIGWLGEARATDSGSCTQPSIPCIPCAHIRSSLAPAAACWLLQMDLLEHPAVCDVIVTSVVLEEVKARNASVYQRLRQLIASDTKRFFVFANEHHRRGAPAAVASAQYAALCMVVALPSLDSVLLAGMASRNCEQGIPLLGMVPVCLTRTVWF